jgi:tetratricopeptide (TPR) repeat protein
MRIIYPLSFIKKTHVKYLQLFIAVIIVLYSCKTKEKPVTKEEAVQFAKSLEKSIAVRNENFFNNAFDMDAMLSKMKAAARDEPGSFWRSVKEGMGEKMKFGSRVIQALGSRGTYALVRQYQQGDKQHLLFRIFSEGSINYHDFELVNKSGNIKIADVYIYLTGELFSKTLKDIFAEVLTSDKKDVAALTDFSKLNKLVQKKEYAEAKEVLDRLPENLKNTKAIQLRNLEICLETDTVEYALAADKFRHDFPDDPSLNLALLDGMIVRGKYTAAIACINQLDSQLNKDPLLDYYRGLLYNLQGKTDAALLAFETLYKNMPEFSPGAMELCTYYMDKGEYKKAGDIIKKTKSNNDFDKSVAENLLLLYPRLKNYTTD